LEEYEEMTNPENAEIIHKLNQEKRNKALKEIFDFYSRQQMMIGKKATFDQIKNEVSNMNLGEYMGFCNDFDLMISKEVRNS
jgi:hypothetical protein